MNVQIRNASDTDTPAIADLVRAAFGDVSGQEVADLVTDLLVDPSAYPLISLVATVDTAVVGHILFTSAHIQPSQRMVSAAILAPLAVHPTYHRQGIGGRLIEAGLKQVKAMGVELVFVLGHSSYYPRHGFSLAGIQGFDAPYPIRPEDVNGWMVQALHPEILGHVRGRVICAEALDDPKHWRE